ncbi:DUF2924 domain-containing protein [Methylobacterium longum]|uniref:DUF2924 domain-containing protein n=1 Tax=Methylobacterium longum TaxID=767694 RepID=A0ABT8AUG2_9HYPH|nr:DUF2924 domain-containing protein [Methylobacterium longum]MDN3573116.1 DUF2924 domain-containing protein [Methylobacterium longum]GJE13722.1 hypothetical protein FOHLNKBM_4786 [Methylobacterium longum]
MTSSDLVATLAALPGLSTVELRTEWRCLFRTTLPLLSRDLLVRALAHRTQELAHGGLTKATQRRLRALTEMALDADPLCSDARAPALRPVTLSPGTRLVREWGGRTHVVTVTADGFEHDGRRYRSLSHVASTITDAHWSGPRFFGLTGTRGAARHG